MISSFKFVITSAPWCTSSDLWCQKFNIGFKEYMFLYFARNVIAVHKFNLAQMKSSEFCGLVFSIVCKGNNKKQGRTLSYWSRVYVCQCLVACRWFFQYWPYRHDITKIYWKCTRLTFLYIFSWTCIYYFQSSLINLFSPWYSWKTAELALNTNHSLTLSIYTHLWEI